MILPQGWNGQVVVGAGSCRSTGHRFEPRDGIRFASFDIDYLNESNHSQRVLVTSLHREDTLVESFVFVVLHRNQLAVFDQREVKAVARTADHLEFLVCSLMSVVCRI